MRIWKVAMMALLLSSALSVYRAEEPAGNEAPSDRARLDELAKRLESLEERVNALEQAVPVQPGASGVAPLRSAGSDTSTRPAPTKVSEVSRLVLREGATTGSVDRLVQILERWSHGRILPEVSVSLNVPSGQRSP